MYRLIISLLVFANFIVVYVVYLLFYPIKVVELKRFEVREDMVKRGDTVTVDIEFYKYHPYRGEISWYIRNGLAFELADGGRYRPVGKNVDTIKIRIPDNPALVPGEHTIQVDISYNLLGGLRTINYTWVTEPFIITE